MKPVFKYFRSTGRFSIAVDVVRASLRLERKSLEDMLEKCVEGNVL
jgi:hypothetical protein